MIGQGLQHLLQSPMAGGQQQFPDPTDIVKQIMQQFQEYVRKRGTEAIPLGGGQGIQEPAQQSIQAPIGTPPREKAGIMRSAAGEGAATYLEQAGEAAAEPWKPKALDIGLMAATIALPIIAAMQPEGRGRRGQRKQQRMQDLFKTLGGFAGQGLKARMGSFEAGKEATLGAAKTRAEMSVEEAQAGYERDIGRIGYERGVLESDRAFDIATGRLGLQEKKLEWEMGKPPKLPKPTGQLTELQRGNYALKMLDLEIDDVLIKANQKYQSLDKGLRKRLGGGSITDFVRLEKIANQLARGGIDIKNSWFTGDYAVDSTLQGLVDDYNEAIKRKRDLLQRLSGQGGQTGLGIGETPLTPEEKAELEARRQRR